MAMNLRQCQQVIDLVKEKNVFFLEVCRNVLFMWKIGSINFAATFVIQGFWSRFFPAYSDLNNLLEANSIGDVKHIQATFGFDAYRDGTAPERLINKDLGG